MTSYRSALIDAMSALAENKKTIFLGQSIIAGGTAMAGTLEHIPIEKRQELPVFENTQIGMSTGLALAGWLPVTIFPRINFLLEAVGQLTQHLDRLVEYGNGYNPRVIIRTAVASDDPMNPGPQHHGEYFIHVLRELLIYTPVWELTSAEEIVPAYLAATRRDGSTILVEHLEMY